MIGLSDGATTDLQVLVVCLILAVIYAVCHHLYRALTVHHNDLAARVLRNQKETR